MQDRALSPPLTKALVDAQLAALDRNGVSANRRVKWVCSRGKSRS